MNEDSHHGTAMSSYRPMQASHRRRHTVDEDNTKIDIDGAGEALTNTTTTNTDPIDGAVSSSKKKSNEIYVGRENRGSQGCGAGVDVISGGGRGCDDGDNEDNEDDVDGDGCSGGGGGRGGGNDDYGNKSKSNNKIDSYDIDARGVSKKVGRVNPKENNMFIMDKKRDGLMGGESLNTYSTSLDPKMRERQGESKCNRSVIALNRPDATVSSRRRRSSSSSNNSCSIDHEPGWEGSGNGRGVLRRGKVGSFGEEDKKVRMEKKDDKEEQEEKKEEEEVERVGVGRGRGRGGGHSMCNEETKREKTADNDSGVVVGGERNCRRRASGSESRVGRRGSVRDGLYDRRGAVGDGDDDVVVDDCDGASAVVSGVAPFNLTTTTTTNVGHAKDIPLSLSLSSSQSSVVSSTPPLLSSSSSWLPRESSRKCDQLDTTFNDGTSTCVVDGLNQGNDLIKSLTFEDTTDNVTPRKDNNTVRGNVSNKNDKNNEDSNCAVNVTNVGEKSDDVITTNLSDSGEAGASIGRDSVFLLDGIQSRNNKDKRVKFSEGRTYNGSSDQSYDDLKPGGSPSDSKSSKSKQAGNSDKTSNNNAKHDNNTVTGACRSNDDSGSRRVVTRCACDVNTTSICNKRDNDKFIDGLGCASKDGDNDYCGRLTSTCADINSSGCCSCNSSSSSSGIVDKLCECSNSANFHCEHDKPNTHGLCNPIGNKNSSQFYNDKSNVFRTTNQTPYFKSHSPIKSALKKTFPHRPNNKCSPLSNQSNQSPARRCNQSGSENIVSSNPHPLHSTQIPIQKSHTPKPIVPLKNSNLTHHNNNTNHNNNNCNSNNKPHPYPSQSPTGPYTHHENNQHFAANSPDENEKSFHKKQNLHKTDPQNDSLLPGTPATNPYTHLQQNTRLSGSQSPDHQQYQQKRTHPENHVHRVWGDCSKNEIASIDRSDNNAHFSPQTDRENNIPCNANSYFYDEASLLDYPENAIYYINDDLSSNFSTDYGDDNSFVLGISENSINTLNEEYEDEEIFVFTHSGTKNVTFCDDDDDNDDDDSLGFHVLKTGADNTSDNNNCQRNLPSSLKGKGVRGAGKGGKEAGGARRKLRVEFAVMEGEERCEGMKRMGLFDGRRDEHGGGAGREMGGGMGGDDVDDADDEECGDVFDAKEEIENDVMLRTGSSRFRQPRVSLLGKPLNYKAHRRDMRYRWIQARIYNFLERPKTWPSWMYHFAVFALILLCLTLGVLCSIADFENILAYAIYVEILMLLAVMLEFALRLWAAGCRSRYQGKAGRLKYLRRPLCIIDMILILASVSALLLGTTQDHFASAVLSGLRFFQILRMVRMDRRGNSWKLLGSVVWAHRQELVTTLYIGVIGLVFSSYFVYLAEKDQPRPSSDTDAKPKFSNFADAIWWGVVTLCTVGYGDVVPATWGGKLIASISAIFGISFFALPAGILGSGFALKVQQQQRQKHLNRRRVPAANLIQCLWRCYAADENSMSTATWKPHLIPCPSPTSDRAFKNNTSFVSRFSTRRRDRSNTSGGGGGLGNNTTSPSGSNITTPTTNGHSPMITRHHSRRAAISNSEEEVPNVLDRSHLSLATGLTDNKLQLDPISFKKENSVSSICKDSEEEGDLSPRLTQLTEQHKKGIRALRKIRYFVSRRKFREALRPYDVKDVIEQYSAGHVDMLGRIKNLQGRLDQILGRQGSKSKDVYESKVCLASRVVKVERQVDDIETKVDLLVDMYKEDRKLLLTYIQHQGGMAAAAATSSGGAGGGNVMTSSQLQSCINKTSSSNNHSSSTPAPINTSFKPRPILIDKQITSEPGTPTSLSTGDHATRHPTKPIIHRNLSDLSQRIKKRVTYRSLPFNDPPSRAQSTTNFISASPNLGNSTLSPPCQLQTPDGSNQSYSVPNTDIGVSTCPTNQLSNTSTTLPLSLNSLSSTLTQSYTNTASNMSASNYNTSNTINSLPPLNNNSNNNNSNNSQNSQMKTPTNSSHNEGIKPFDLSGSTGNYQPPSNTSPPNNQFSSNPSSFFSSDLDLSSVASNRNNNNGMNNDDINNMNEESNSLFERLTNIEYLDSTPTQQHLIFEDPESSKPDDAWGPSNKPLSTLNEQRSTESDSSLPGILISSTSIPHASIPPISSCPNQTITTTTPIPLSMCASPSSSSSPSETHKSPFMGNSHNVNTSRGSNKLGGNSKIYPSVRFQDMCGGGGGGATGNSGTTSGSCSSNTDIDMNKTQTLVDLSIPGQDTIPTSGGVGGIPLTESMTAAANSGNNNSIAAGVLGGHHSDPYAILIGGNDEDINPSRRQDTIHLAHQRITHL